MKDLDSLLLQTNKDFKLGIKVHPSKEFVEKSEVLFHLPLLAMIVLVVTSRTKVKFAVEDLNYWVTRVLLEIYPSFVYSEQRLRLSSAFRKRSVDAVVFLESSSFIEVQEVEGRRVINLTKDGRKFLSKNQIEAGEVSRILYKIEKSVSRILAKGNELV